MSDSTSLYRRHRPGSFDEVVGQQHVVRTLRNAVEQGKVHHAYLFVGSRGTGKTSMAKILARSLNCERGGPTVTPCGECESCVTIAAGTSIDVIEMDAASNRSVDDVRDLRERVAYAPAGGHWKVYILDEAHMLTKEAWNAFLKTLEEPPPNTVFVLATTEAHKVMATIADRCQRFDFQRPSLEQISEVLNRVAAAEGIEVEEGAVAMIARSASGSFRDALGTLDQLVAFGGSKVGLDDGAGAARRRRRRAALRRGRRGRRRGPARRSCSGSRRWPAPAATRPSSPATCSPTCATCWSPRRSARCPNTFVVTATDAERLAAQAGGDRRRDAGPHDRRAGGGADRGARGRRRAHGGRDRAAEGGAPGPRSRRPRDCCGGSSDSSSSWTRAAGPRVLSRQEPAASRQRRSSAASPPPRHPRQSAAAEDEPDARAASRADPAGAPRSRRRRRGRRARTSRPSRARDRTRRRARASTWRRFSGSGRRCSISCAKTAPALAATFEGARPVGFDGEERAARSAFPPTRTFNKRKAEAPEKREQLAEALRDGDRASGCGRPTSCSTASRRRRRTSAAPRSERGSTRSWWRG